MLTAVALTPAAAQTPLARAEFDAATIKLSPPNSQMTPPMRQLMANMHDLVPPGMMPRSPGRINIHEEPLLQIVALAWSVRLRQISGPKWASEELFDVEGTFPKETSGEDVHKMLQTLLEDRFGLKLHRAQTNLKGYALLAKEGSKLQAAAPIQPRADVGPPPIPKSPGLLAPGTERSAYKNITTETLAAILSRMVEGPVVDMTGLTGKYDVELETSRDAPENPGTTIFDAVRDLGLRLEPGKVPMEMLVIDEIRRSPSPN